MVVLVEEYVDKMSWDTFKTWWSSYREIFAPTDDLSGPLLMLLGAAADKISYELCGGDRFKQWTKTGLLEVRVWSHRTKQLKRFLQLSLR